MDLYIQNKIQSSSLWSLTDAVRYKIVVFILPLTKQNNFHDHSCNSSNEFIVVDARTLALHYRDFINSRVVGLAS